MLKESTSLRVHKLYSVCPQSRSFKPNLPNSTPIVHNPQVPVNRLVVVLNSLLLSMRSISHDTLGLDRHIPGQLNKSCGIGFKVTGADATPFVQSDLPGYYHASTYMSRLIELTCFASMAIFLRQLSVSYLAWTSPDLCLLLWCALTEMSCRPLAWISHSEAVY